MKSNQNKEKDINFNIKNKNIAEDNFSWGGNTVQWQQKAEDIANKHKSYKGEKSHKLK